MNFLIDFPFGLLSLVEDAPFLSSVSNNPAGIGEITLMTSREFWLSVLILLFGLIVIAGQMYFLRDNSNNVSENANNEHVIRLSIVSMIIVGALVFVASGYTESQVGPAMGLFGTVAGYLLGRQDRGGGNKS